MFRPLIAALALALAGPALAQPRVTEERAAGVQKASAAARQFLTLNMPANAVAVLEPYIPDADPAAHPGFFTLLRDAYRAELTAARAADPARAADLERKLSLMRGLVPEPAAAVVPAPAPAADAARAAAAAFQAGRFADAARLFADADKAGAVGPAERAAWAYSRLTVAADRLAANADPAAVAAEVEAALALVPDDAAKLKAVGQRLLAAARQKAGPAVEAGAPAADGWEVVETASFRVRHRGARDAAAAVAAAAEAKRADIFGKWSGPPAGGWQPKCDVYLHPTADDYARTTGKPAAGTGHAVVRLSGGRAAERRIDLRADDRGLTADALPREITHVVLADLFPDRPPPKWAVEGMAVLASSDETVGRYHRTLLKCQQTGQLFAVADLLGLADYPADRLTGFYCESVSVVDFLVRQKGEKAFTMFLREIPRYGLAPALKRQYDLDGPAGLERAWRAAALVTARGQTP